MQARTPRVDRLLAPLQLLTPLKLAVALQLLALLPLKVALQLLAPLKLAVAFDSPRQRATEKSRRQHMKSSRTVGALL